MSDAKRKWDILTDEKRKIAIKEIIYYFKEQRDETIGIIAAEGLLDFFLQHVGEDIYNSALFDSKKWLRVRLDDIEIEFDQLFK